MANAHSYLRVHYFRALCAVTEGANVIKKPGFLQDVDCLDLRISLPIL
jgi:hypothetical protein